MPLLKFKVINLNSIIDFTNILLFGDYGSINSYKFYQYTYEYEHIIQKW